MIDKSVIDTVIKKFLTSEREPNFYKKPEYKNYPKERNQQIYASSCWFKNHWSWQLFQDYCVNMVDENKKYFVCGLPYQLSIAEGLLNRDQVEDEMSESTFDTIKFSIKSCADKTHLTFIKGVQFICANEETLNVRNYA